MENPLNPPLSHGVSLPPLCQPQGLRTAVGFRLVALDKRPGVRPVGIGETLCRALAKLVMRAAGEQAKMACGNLQICAGLEAVIEGATHAVEKRRVERLRARRGDGAHVEEEATVQSDDEGNEEVADLRLNNLRIETAVGKVEAEEGLKAALGMEVDEVEGREGEEEGGGMVKSVCSARDSG